MKTTSACIIIAAFSIGVIFGACTPSAPNSSASESSRTDSSTKAESAIIPKTIKIGTFNIQNLGVTKIGKAAVVKELVSIIRKYDVIAIQEISDKANHVAYRFLDSINKNQTIPYSLILSQRSGQQADDVSDQEQYAFYYNTSTIKDLGQSMLYNDSAYDYFEREPFLAHFKVVKGNFSFVLSTVHTKPDLAVKEIKAIDEVIKWAKVKYTDEDDFIALGDFNGSCTYASPEQLDELEIRKTNYRWLIADTVKTNLSTKQCAYDRFVITNPATTTDFTGNWGVDRCFTSKTISDHWPVWAEFYTTKDVKKK
jgi:endonuclease/exonuclease/phosphatase family metal-dependent hydrolase